MSDNNEYRYRLTRTWDKTKELVGLIMFNPSKANALKTDDTIMNITNYLIDHDYGGVDIVNLFSYMSINKSGVTNRDQTHERLNDNYILRVAKKANTLIIAWGPNEEEQVLRKREVENLLSPYAGKLICFEDEDGKSPRHPLHLSDKWSLVQYSFRYI
ncbi:DUF1643 domain-containing protein [Cohnella soli]|uniref:DUF1643 domain-containing protein n=1 Tax=Cohnella soli TaxID=425005 RepID=A0ABW0HLR8_9BACL